jgi:inner membrane protein
MATPIGHSIAGFAISRLLPEDARKDAPLLTVVCVGMAVLPDMDVLPGLISGMPAFFHGGMSHSFFAGAIISLLVALIFRTKHLTRLQLFAFCFAAYSTHLFMDFVNTDGRAPYGIPLFWPFTDAAFISPIPVFIGMHHSDSATDTIGQFLDAVFSSYNVLAIALEMAILAPHVWLASQVQRWRQQEQHIALVLDGE